MNELEQKAYIFGAMFALANKLQVLGDAFDENITIKQWLFIIGVSKFDDPPTVSEVANHVGYSRQNAKRIAAALHERGYVTVAKDKNDARALRITLTQKCTEYFASRSLKELEFLENLFIGFDAELIRDVYEGLIRLDKNIEGMMNND
ncbi:MAG: MarR family winged helix-turn-helix transcriptional regulator [Chitinophagales bacterium]